MRNNYSKIQELLQQKADYQARLNLLPYDGYPEVKSRGEKKYLYVRKRVAGKNTSHYVDVYSDALYQLLQRNEIEARELNKAIKAVEKQLAQLGYEEAELSARVLLNLDFARINMKISIYEQAVLEGVATTFSQTEEIIDNGKINGVIASDVQKVLNLKHAWEFILDKDVISYPTDYSLICHIAQLINEGFYINGRRLRGVPVAIGGTSYIPPLPVEADVKGCVEKILAEPRAAIDSAIELCLYIMKSQLFNDGNKRAAILSANHFLISQGEGLLVVPEQKVPDFKRLLVAYYENRSIDEMIIFLKKHAWRHF